MLGLFEIMLVQAVQFFLKIMNGNTRSFGKFHFLYKPKVLIYYLEGT